jgi:hypothetical protein
MYCFQLITIEMKSVAFFNHDKLERILDKGEQYNINRNENTAYDSNATPRPLRALARRLCLESKICIFDLVGFLIDLKQQKLLRRPPITKAIRWVTSTGKIPRKTRPRDSQSAVGVAAPLNRAQVLLDSGICPDPGTHPMNA